MEQPKIARQMKPLPPLPTPDSPASSCVSTSRDSVDVLNTEANVEVGKLNLSRQGLTGVSLNFKSEYNEVSQLDVSHNKLHSLKSQLFPNCAELNISNNRLSRLTSLSHIAPRLKQLNVSENELVSIDGMQNFLRLEQLICFNNSIKIVPQLQMFSLKVLDLSGNFLTSVPDLSGLQNLEALNLSGNEISSLDKVIQIDWKLKELAIASNNIEDISHIIFLGHFSKLSNIVIYPLPCLPKDDENAPFNYRHLMLCVLPQLEQIDGQQVETTDVLCGEHLLITGKLTGAKKEFFPGSGEKAHEYIWNYLTKKNEEFVGKEKISTPLKGNMMKYLTEKERYQKMTPLKMVSSRQELVISPAQSRATEDEFSTHSPYADWNRQMGKENTDPETTDVSPTSSCRSGITKNLRIIEAVAGRKPLMRRSGSVGSRLTSSAPPDQPTETEKDENESKEVVSSGRANTETPLLQVQNTPPQPKARTKISTEPEIYMISPLHKSACDESDSEDIQSDCMTPRVPFMQVSTPMSRRRINTPSRKFGVADITALTYSGYDFDMQERMREMEEKMVALSEFCDNLSKTNEQLTNLLVEQKEAFDDELRKMQRKLDSLSQPPKPIALSISRRRKGSDVEIKWELKHVYGYNVYIDGQRGGTVNAPGRYARITDLEPNREHTIQLRALSKDGSEGPISDPLKVPSL